MRTFNEFVMGVSLDSLARSLQSMILQITRNGDASDELEVGHALFGDKYFRSDGDDNWALYDGKNNLLGIMYDGYQWVPKNKIDEEDAEILKKANGSVPGKTLEEICLKFIKNSEPITRWGDYGYQVRPDVIKKVYENTYVIIISNNPAGVSFDDFSVNLETFVEMIKAETAFLPDEDFYQSYQGEKDLQDILDFNYKEFAQERPEEFYVWEFLEKNYPSAVPSRKINN